MSAWLNKMNCTLEQSVFRVAHLFLVVSLLPSFGLRGACTLWHLKGASVPVLQHEAEAPFAAA